LIEIQELEDKEGAYFVYSADLLLCILQCFQPVLRPNKLGAVYIYMLLLLICLCSYL